MEKKAEMPITGLTYDHLGSVTTITNSSGAIVQELSYDAWGNLRNPYYYLIHPFIP